MRGQGAVEGLSGRMNASLSSRSGNVDATSLAGGSRVDFTRVHRTVFLVLEGDYGWQGGKRFSDQGLVHLRYVHGLTARVAAEGFVQGDYNKARLLEERAVVGAGVRITFIAGKRAGLSSGSSYMFEHEKIDLPASARHPRETDVGRWSNYAALRWAFNDRSRVNVTAYAQPRIDDFGDIRAIAETALNVLVGGPVSLTVVGSLRHDSEPPDHIKPTDTKVVTGVTVSF